MTDKEYQLMKQKIQKTDSLREKLQELSKAKEQVSCVRFVTKDVREALHLTEKEAGYLQAEISAASMKALDVLLYDTEKELKAL